MLNYTISAVIQIFKQTDFLRLQNVQKWSVFGQCCCSNLNFLSENAWGIMQKRLLEWILHFLSFNLLYYASCVSFASLNSLRKLFKLVWVLSQECWTKLNWILVLKGTNSKICGERLVMDLLFNLEVLLLVFREPPACSLYSYKSLNLHN